MTNTKKNVKNNLNTNKACGKCNTSKMMEQKKLETMSKHQYELLKDLKHSFDALVQKNDFTKKIEILVNDYAEEYAKYEILGEDTQFILEVFHKIYVKRENFRTEFICNKLLEVLDRENIRFNRRLDRLKKNFEEHAPRLIIEGEEKLIFKSMKTIDILDALLQKAVKPARPEDKLFLAIFGELL